MRILTLLLALISLECLSQDSSNYLPPYSDNFPPSYERNSIKIRSNNIRIPISVLRNLISFKMDSLNTIELLESEEKDYLLAYKNYKIYYSTSYTWTIQNPKSKDIVVGAYFELKPRINGKFVDEHTFSEFIYAEDSLRYILHNTLRIKFENYLLKRTNNNYNLNSITQKVDKIYLYENVEPTESSKNLIKLKDTTLLTYTKFKRILNKGERDKVIKILSSTSESLSRYNTLCFIPQHRMILVDNENNYLGEFEIVTEDMCVPGYSFSLKLNKNYFYSGSSIFYKKYEDIKSILIK